MSFRSSSRFKKLIAAAAFLIMITVNVLANTLPINGRTTGQVSDSYPNLFAPAGFTFAVWGLIYLLLALHVLYQLGLFRGNTAPKTSLLRRVGLPFSLSCLANAAWVFAWHYDKILLSLLFMAVILVCLVIIHLQTRRKRLSARDVFFVRLPFSVYFGWITVAAVANVTVFLVSIGWDGFGIPEWAWTAAMLAVGAVIAVTTIIRSRDFAYGLVLLWAYAGILVKHTSQRGFHWQYPVVIAAVSACMVLITAAELYILLRVERSRHK